MIGSSSGADRVGETIYEADEACLHTGSPADPPRTPLPRVAGGVARMGVGLVRGRFADLGGNSGPPSTPSRPHDLPRTPFCPSRSQVGFGVGARGAPARQEGIHTRCPIAPINPLTPQEISPIVQSGPWPPPSPSPTPLPVSHALAHWRLLAAPSGRVKSRRIRRALLAAPLLKAAATLLWLRGCLGGR